MNIALVHDHLTQEGGAEQVLSAFHALYPSAPIMTLVHDTRVVSAFRKSDVRSSFLQSFPFRALPFPWLFPLMPSATEAHDLSPYQIVLSSSSGFSKGVITKAETLHICYCHTPARYLWNDTHQYVADFPAPRILKALAPFFVNTARQWDRCAADRVDLFIANSKAVARRIKKYYRRDATVIYPPVNCDRFRQGSGVGGYYLAGGRLVSYKRFDIAVSAFNRLGIPLKIFGSGPEFSRLRKSARKNVEFLGMVSNEAKARLYEECIAYVHPQEEDFGITAVEAASAGRPAICYGRGGARETVIDGVTGVFFDDQDAAALIAAVMHFDAGRFDSALIRAHAQKYGTERFRREITDFVTAAWARWQELQKR